MHQTGPTKRIEHSAICYSYALNICRVCQTAGRCVKLVSAVGAASRQTCCKRRRTLSSWTCDNSTKLTTLATIDVLWWLSRKKLAEFRVQEQVPHGSTVSFYRCPNFPYNTFYDKSRVASVPKTRFNRTPTCDGQMDRQRAIARYHNMRVVLLEPGVKVLEQTLSVCILWHG